MSLNAVSVLAVSATSVTNPAPLRSRSIKYPVIAEPPSLAGVVQRSSAVVEFAASADKSRVILGTAMII